MFFFFFKKKLYEFVILSQAPSTCDFRNAFFTSLEIPLPLQLMGFLVSFLRDLQAFHPVGRTHCRSCVSSKCAEAHRCVLVPLLYIVFDKSFPLEIESKLKSYYFPFSVFIVSFMVTCLA